MRILVTPLCTSIIITFVFIHCHFKRYEFIVKLNDYLLFKKNLFNKKQYYPAENKAVISFFFLTCIKIALFMMTCHLQIEVEKPTFFPDILWVILFLGIIGIIERLIYEFLVIPHSYKKKIYESQLQNINAQPYIQNTQFAQQPIQNIQQPSPTNNVIINNQTISIPEEQQFKFCSQCGTKYNVTDETCPNCGLH
ncbi:MAG: hypothetical protein HDQ97_17445 [Lachnospiraceae bacterium]|nr:hypothetical protein [Lachnospiraceae bacterium]